MYLSIYPSIVHLFTINYLSCLSVYLSIFLLTYPSMYRTTQGKFQEAAQLYKKAGQEEKVWLFISHPHLHPHTLTLLLSHSHFSHHTLTLLSHSHTSPITPPTYPHTLTLSPHTLTLPPPPHSSQAMEMFTDLRQFDLAKDFLGGSNQKNVKELITKQADWARTTNDPQAAW